MSAEIKSNSCK